MIDFLLYLQTFSTPLLDKIFLGISALTGEFVYIAVLGIVYWCINKDKAYYIGIFLLFSFSLNSFLKNLFKIPRPFTYSDVRQIDTDTGYGYSFPSGHAQMSTTFSGMFSTIFKRKWIYAVGVILVLLTGVSRMYLGVHTPLDILCGIITGLLITFAGTLLDRIGKPRLIALISFVFMLIVAILYKDEDILKLLFFAAGFLSGNILDEKFIGFAIPQKIKICLIGAVAGFASTIVLIVVLKALGLTYIRYLCMGLFITVVVPAMIKQIDKKLR